MAFTAMACGQLAPMGDAGPDAATDAARDKCTLVASSYDQSCTSDSDCVAVWFGDVCTTACAGCEPNGAINVSSTNAYGTDARNATDASTVCPCPPPMGHACCSAQGVCGYCN